MVIPHTLPELRQAVRDRVAAADAGPYNQRRAGSPQTWTESDLPLSAVVASGAQGHLSYSVSIVAAPVRATDHSAYGLECDTQPRVVVDFLFSLRPGRRVADEDLAAQAAQDVARTVCRHPSLYPEEVFRPALVGEGQYLLVVQEYSATLTVPL